MSKVLALCEAAGLDFIEAWQNTVEHKPSHTFFTDEQDKAFFRNPHLFRFFIELFYENQSPEQIQKQWKLTPSSLHLYLRKLESLGLITSFKSEDVTFAVQAPLGFKGGSLVLRHGVITSLKDYIAAVDQENEIDQFIALKPMRLSEELRNKLHEEIVEIISRFAALSERYFWNSEHKAFNFVAFEYQDASNIEAISIKNVRGFK